MPAGNMATCVAPQEQKGIADVRAKRINGFSLMEMMVVLLIVAIIAAASAPMVTKNLSRGAGTGDSPWVFTGLNNNIAYNLNGSDASAIIGHTSYTSGANGPRFPRLVLASGNDAQRPALAFADANGNFSGQINMNTATGVVTMSNALVGQESVAIGLGQTIGEAVTRVTALGQGVTALGSCPIAIGYQASAINNNAIAIGAPTARRDIQNVRAQGVESIAIGTSVTASGANSIAIGSPILGNILGINTQDRTEATDSDSIAIGTGTDAAGVSAVAIGRNAGASGDSGTAIGNSANASGEDSIAIGNADATNESSIAIGTSANASNQNSVAIGPGATTENDNEIVLGDENTTIRIPGTLQVGKNTYLGTNLSVNDLQNLKHSHGPIKHYGAKAGLYIRTVNWSGNLEEGWLTVYDSDGGSTSQALCITSDRRLKNIGETYTAGLTELKKLDFFHYTFKKDENKTPHVGVIAQDLQKVFPDAVTKGEDGYLRIRWEDMFYAVINAVKELDNKITEIVQNITNINTTIEKQNKTIESLLTTLDAQQKTIEEQQQLIKNLEKRIKKLEG